MPKGVPYNPAQFVTIRYGLQFQGLKDQKGRYFAHLPEPQIELHVLRNHKTLKEQGFKVLEWKEHFKRFVASIWDRPGTKYRFTWNPYACRMLDVACKYKFVGIAGHASSGKSQFGAIWGLANFLIGSDGPNGEKENPCSYVKVFVTSTTLEESRLRIWGVIESAWLEACAVFGGEKYMPGVLISSRNKIVYRSPINGKKSDLAGVSLIAGGIGHDKESNKLLGFKARKLILIADELPLLTHRIYEAAKGNLNSNADAQMIGIGNPTSVFDPFGIFIAPKSGWHSVTEHFEGWETELGYALHFDGEKSPNVLAGRELYPGLLTLPKLLEYQAMHGAKSFVYFQMVRGFICPTGAIDSIYTEPELVSSLALQKVTNWLNHKTPIAFLDPSFSKGGDAAAASFGFVGNVFHPISQREQKVLELVEVIDLMQLVDAKHPTKDRNEQLADLFIQECDKRKVAVPDRGIDCTGAGDPFGTILAMKMGTGFQMVSFAGKASDMTVSQTDRRTAETRFRNRVSELWYVGKEFIRMGQIKGIDPATALEMTARTFEGGDKEKILVESKEKMRERTNGKSPDRADSLMGLVEICRRRHGFATSAKALAKAPKPIGPSDPLASMFNWGMKKSPEVFSPIHESQQQGSGWADFA